MPILPFPQISRCTAIALAFPLSLCTLHAEPDADGFHPLFNGTDLTGWSGDPQFWSVEDGVIVGQSTEEAVIEENTFLIWQGGEIDDFELEVDFKIESGNSGIQVRSWMVPEPQAKHAWRLNGYQSDFEAGDTWPGLIYGEGFRGISAKRGEVAVFRPGENKPEVIDSLGDPAELLEAVNKGDWNTYRIVARGFVIEHYINGTKMAELRDEDPAARVRSGLLGFQLHKGAPMKVSFRNVRLKRLAIEDATKIVFIAGVPSHGYGSHEHNAGCDLLDAGIEEALGEKVVSTVYHSGWPNDPTAFVGADSIIMYCDGGGRHFAKFHLRQLDELHRAGVGIGAIHYGVEIPKGEGLEEFTQWMGGGFETDWSVNPHWTADFKEFPEHPITQGVQPFAINDEWYYHMRFREGMDKVTPILTAMPGPETLTRRDGPHSGNPHVRKDVEAGNAQHVCWASESLVDGGGRGFGFTGGHFHRNWQQDDFRKTALNAVAWISGIEVPAGGLVTETPTEEEMLANIDPNQKNEASGGSMNHGLDK